MDIGVGGGTLAQMRTVPTGKGPKTSIGKAFCIMKDDIENKSTAEDVYLSINFPRWLYKMFAEMGWRQQIKKNGGIVKDLNKKY